MDDQSTYRELKKRHIKLRVEKMKLRFIWFVLLGLATLALLLMLFLQSRMPFVV